jgi:serine/threonine protein kinase
MSKIGRYEVEAEVGSGAMGRVFLAKDPRLRRRVAIKVHSLPQGLSPEQEAEYRERFLREAQAAAVLSHPGIVTVYDAGEDPETELPYIAMEYVDGCSLRQQLDEQSRLEPERARAIGVALASALNGAHEAGIVHRDVKPANILVRKSDGGVKIADFGIARLSSSELTNSGTSLGSPAYMSPEQVRGRNLDGRSDLFSLAVLLYESLCGVRPFTGEDFTALAYAIVHETPVPITRRSPELPRGLEAFFDRALAKDPAKRFTTGAEFARALAEAFQDDRPAEVDATVIASSSTAEAGEQPPAETDPPDWGVDLDSSPLPGTELDVDRRVRRRFFAAAAILFLLVVAGWALFGGKRDAYLKLDAKSSLETGELSLLVDGEEVYSRALSAPKKVKKKNLIKKLLDQRHETFEAWIEIEPGKHEVVAQVTADGQNTGYRDTVVVDLEPGETRKLRMTAGRAFGSGLSLKVN